MFNKNKYFDALLKTKDKEIDELKKIVDSLKQTILNLEKQIKKENEILKICKDNDITEKKLIGFLKLKKCKFCGGETFINKYQNSGVMLYGPSSHTRQPYNYIKYNKYNVRCTKCGATGPGELSIDEAIKAYNVEEEKTKKSKQRKKKNTRRTNNKK